MENTTRNRWEMVSGQIAARGVRGDKALSAMRLIPRHEFLPEHLRAIAYEDRPVLISDGLTLMQPYVVAYLIEALGLKGGEKVLLIGAGTGYVAAVLAAIAGQVFIIEHVGQHAETATTTLIDIGCRNFHLRHDDGTQGWIEESPFDAILVSGAAPFVPEVLKNQLAPGGCMVVPVGIDPRAQELVRVTRHDRGQFVQEDLADLRFVPLISNQGWEGTRGRMADWVSARTSCATSTPAAPTVAMPAAPPPFRVRLSASTSRAGGKSGPEWGAVDCRLTGLHPVSCPDVR